MPPVQEPTVTITHKPVKLSDIEDQGRRALDKVQQLRGRILSPMAKKTPPTISSTDLCELCRIEKHALTYRLSKEDLPQGTVLAAGRRREFALSDAQQWVRAYRGNSLRPAGAPACTIALGNFKGGSTKTTTTMTLAQGLSLRGHRVLTIDLDPQASLSQLFGILSDTEVDDEHTLTEMFLGDHATVDYAIRQTYWPGIDVIPASSALFNTEFLLPARQVKDREFSFWDVLNAGLVNARREYDVIIIDTPPALSYLTINGFMAADGVIVPVPPGSLDFASSAHFWYLFGEIAGGLERRRNLTKEFSFVHVLLSRVNTQDSASGAVRQWITEVYGERVLPVVIPQTAVATYASAMFGTVYDLDSYDGSRKTYLRAKEAYDGFCELIEQSIQQFWTHGPFPG